MPRSDWYVTHRKLPAFGRMFFLKVLQKGDAPGGGESLLGSVVQEANEYDPLGIFQVGWYPIPMHASEPRSVLKALEARKKDLGIENAVLSTELSALTDTVSIKSKHSIGAGVSTFPGLPLGLGVDLNYGWLDSVTITFDKARIAYIPLGHLGRLFRAVDGDHRKVDDSGLLGGNNIVDSVLLAKKYKVQVKSEYEFNPEFEAKLKAMQGMPGLNAKYELDRQTKKSLTASISGKDEYLAALGVKDWDDCDLD